MTATIIRGMSPEDYHAHPALSRSRLKVLLSGTPRDFVEAPPVEETAAMRLGTAAHMAILEPERFAALVRPMPDFGDGRTKAAKDAKAHWEAHNAGKIAVPEDDYRAATAAARLVRDRRGPAAALRTGNAEVSMFFGYRDVLVKARPDFADFERKLVCDVKTTKRDLSDQQGLHVLVHQYSAMQAAMVNCAAHELLGHGVTPYLLLVRLAPPVDVRLIEVTLPWLEYGEAQFLRALGVYRECMTSGEWPGWAERNVTEVPFPSWLEKQTNAMNIAVAEEAA